MRLIAFSIVILAGGIVTCIGSLSATASTRDMTQTLGILLLMTGVAFLVAELMVQGFFREVVAVFKPPKDPLPKPPTSTEPTEPGR